MVRCSFLLDQIRGVRKVKVADLQRMLRFLRSTKKSLKEEEELLRAPLHNLQEIETNTVFSDRVCIKDDAFWRGLPCGLCFF